MVLPTRTSSTRSGTPFACSARATRDLYIGADRTGRLLEVVLLDADGHPIAIHAMTLRPKFHEHL
jgi:hypothetical protein